MAIAGGLYLLACTATWTCWIVAGAAATTAPRLTEVLDLVGSYGPALAALVVARRVARVTRGRDTGRAVGTVAVLAISVWALSSSSRTALVADRLD